jgi:hypothetical protein
VKPETPSTPATDHGDAAIDDSDTRPARRGARVGRVHTGDVLRELETIKRRTTTVERELGIVSSSAVDDDADELAAGDAGGKPKHKPAPRPAPQPAPKPDSTPSGEGARKAPRRNFFEDVERELWGDAPEAA